MSTGAPPPEDPAGVPPPPAEGDGAPGPPRCVECGSPLDADQTYCLVCGTPTPLAPRIRRPRTGAWIAAALVVAGVGAGLLGWALADDDGARAATATVTTATVGTVTAPGTGTVTGVLPPDTTAFTTTDGFDTAPTDFVTTAGPATGTGTVDTTGSLPPDTGGFPDDTTDAFPDDTTDEAPPDVAEDPASDWPAGTSAWTAIIASARDGEAARDVRDEAQDQGYGAGILLSDDHPGLTPGLFVVYVGVYSARGDAVAQARRLESAFPGTYPRYISG